MKRFVDVHNGEVMAGAQGTVLHSDSNQACLVICAYDPGRKIGGLAHAQFNKNHHELHHHQAIIRDAGGAIDEMIDDMILLGANKEKIEVCLVTCENVVHEDNDPEYNEVISEALEILKEKHIRFKESSAADAGSQHVTFDVGTGKVSYD